MKAISIIEPYASLILEGKKHIETRSWRTEYRGKILIHASATRIPKEYRRLLPMVDKVRQGYILCTAYLIDCVKMTDEFIAQVDDEERAVGFYSPGRYAWFLSDITPLPYPVHAKGKLGLWEAEVV